jgi:pyrroline-5-carboxylate reductase
VRHFSIRHPETSGIRTEELWRASLKNQLTLLYFCDNLPVNCLNKYFNMPKKTKIGIIGYGNMGSAIAKRTSSKYQLFIFDKDGSKTKNILNAKVTGSVVDLINNVDVVFLAVKPQDFDAVLNEIKNNQIPLPERDLVRKLIISIAAGISTEYIERVLGKVRVTRAMPNLPAKIGKGISCLCKGKFATDSDFKLTRQLFKELGETFILEEKMMNAATAISGSGPGYLYDWGEGRSIEDIKKYAYDIFEFLLSASAQNLGFTKEQAEILSKVTTRGSVKFLETTGFSPKEAKKQVVSKGGTTEAALEMLHKGGSLNEAVEAACKRAKELSR